MAAPLITLRDIHLTFGGTPLLTGADLNIKPNDRVSLVGRNGSGKSTLLKIASRLVEVDSGERFCHPGASIRYLAQEVDFTGFDTTREFAVSGLGPLGDPFEVQILLEEVGLTGDEPTDQLSGGEARRAALVQALVAAPDVLLLDEPTNHLDLTAIEWLEAHLKPLKSAIVVISHDRRFLENLSRATVWLDRGRTRRMDKNFSEFEAWRDKILETEALDQHKLDRKIAREEHWMQGGVSGRRKRNQRRVAELHKMRTDRRNQWAVQGNVKLEAAQGRLASKLVAEAISASKSYDGHAIVKNFSTRIQRGDRVGLVGPNGAGKTTLLNLLTGGLAPDSGKVRIANNLQMVTLDQKRETLDPNATVAEILTGGRGDQVIINDKPRHVASYMKDFLFQPEQARTTANVLSGGERGRLMLARALAKPSNVLVLDEPTNDLDLETLDLLQELLADYDGTVLLVSHDRDFLDRVVTSVIVSEGEGNWLEYAGGYTDMLSQRNDTALLKEAGRASRAKAKDDKLTNATKRAGKETNKTTTPVSAGKTSAKKLTFKDKHALETLPGKIEDLHSEIQSLQDNLSNPDLFTKDPDKFQTSTERLAAALSELGASEEQWLELELKREELAT